MMIAFAKDQTIWVHHEGNPSSCNIPHTFVDMACFVTGTPHPAFRMPPPSMLLNMELHSGARLPKIEAAHCYEPSTLS